MAAIVRVRNLGKRYRLGERAPYRMLRESIMDALRAPARGVRARKLVHSDEGEQWVLRDASFEVESGDVLGIIGPNGAGKSTLLKILSRITEPTTGTAEIYGRVRSLLEVGTGFHPELTGRENIYLNGAILGMRRREVQRRFDDIVAFADVADQIDTPVKRYSSGMYVRLAFAVAVHLEPEILLVDEVLAVGDGAFRRRAIEKIRQLNDSGMTIVLVSHDMWLIQSVCTRAMLLEQGRITAVASPRSTIGAYRRAIEGMLRNPHTSGVRYESAEILSLEITPVGKWVSDVEALPGAGIRLTFNARLPRGLKVKCFLNAMGTDEFPYLSLRSDQLDVPVNGSVACQLTVRHLMLRDGEYIVRAGVCSADKVDNVICQSEIPLTVRDLDSDRTEGGVLWNKAEWSFGPFDYLGG